MPALFPRAAGVLLHPTSLPGPNGIGELGPEAHRWLEWLHAAGQRIWQVLPLGPTGHGNSPYQSYSAFAGNPLLVSPEGLRAEGLLDAEDLADRPALPERFVAFDAVASWKQVLLDGAFRRFTSGASPALARRFGDFRDANAVCLYDYARFMVLKAARHGAAWNEWDPAIRDRDPAALASVDERLAPAIP